MIALFHFEDKPDEPRRIMIDNIPRQGDRVSPVRGEKTYTVERVWWELGPVGSDEPLRVEIYCV